MDETEKTNLKWVYNELDKIVDNIKHLQNDILVVTGNNLVSNNPILTQACYAYESDIDLNTRIAFDGVTKLYKANVKYPFIVFVPKTIVIPLSLYEKNSAGSDVPSDIIFLINLINTLLIDARTESLTKFVSAIAISQNGSILQAQIKFKIGFVENTEGYELDLNESELKWRKVTNE